MDLEWQPQLAHRTWWRYWEWYWSQCGDLLPDTTFADDTAPTVVMASAMVPAPEGAAGWSPKRDSSLQDFT
jgi:hypothetical protein